MANLFEPPTKRCENKDQSGKANVQLKISERKTAPLDEFLKTGSGSGSSSGSSSSGSSSSSSSSSSNSSSSSSIINYL